MVHRWANLPWLRLLMPMRSPLSEVSRRDGLFSWRSFWSEEGFLCIMSIGLLLENSWFSGLEICCSHGNKNGDKEELLNNSLRTLVPHCMKFCQFPLLTSTPPLSALPAMYSLLAFLQDNRLESPLSSPQVIHGVQQLHAAIVTIPTWSIELGIEPWWQDVP